MKGDRNPATSKRKTSEVSEPSSDDDLPLSKRNKRLSSINDSNTATSKRKGSEDSISSNNCLRQSKKTRRLSSTSDTNPAASSKRKHREVSEPSSDDDLRQSKRTKRFSSTHAASNNKRKQREASKPSSDDDLRQSKRLEPERASSTSINDIPKELLVEILCRLPCAKSVFRCKSVSKSWRSLTSDPNFIGRFLWLQRQNQTLIPGTIINRWGYELLTTDLFATFRSFETEKIERLEVLATWNDLVLCRSLRRFGHHICEQSCKCDDGQYYICNPRTSKQEMQLVKLPWIHECGLFWDPIVGFICEPYYKEEEEDDRHADSSTDQKEEGEKRKVIRINAESKFKVVRIVPPEVVQNDHDFFKIQVFSSEIGAWRESLVECPKEFDYYQLTYDKPEHQPEHPRGAFASNGMLYWIAKEGHLLGLGPLMINNKSTTDCSNSTAAESADGDSGYQCHLIKLQDEDEDEDEDGDGDVPPSLYHLQSHRGRLQLVRVDRNEDGNGAKLVVWELAKEELEQMAVQRGGELGQRHRKDYSIMDRIMLPWWPTPLPKIHSLASETSSGQVIQ
ncbi:hypothetical protein ACLB2K_030521 [Fragaria x ananassa]